MQKWLRPVLQDLPSVFAILLGGHEALKHWIWGFSYSLGMFWGFSHSFGTKPHI